MLDYVTYKYVRLRDARLGALYYILALLILIYSLVEIFVRKGYMQVRQLLTATQARLSYGGYGQRRAIKYRTLSSVFNSVTTEFRCAYNILLCTACELHAICAAAVI